MLDGPSPRPTTVTVAIIGAGFAGLGMAIRLRQSGLHDFLVLERADEVGGTWRDNVYPGCACDVPSHLYSFSFDLNPEWSHVFSRQWEIQAYLQRCADHHGVRERVRFGAEVVSARFDEATARWHLRTADGQEVIARFVVHGLGALRDPLYPAIPGREDFRGIAMHSARWDHEAELGGKRIGVVGTGASAIQIVPELAKSAGELVIFQRTPPWIRRRPDRPYRAVEKALFRRLPAAMRWHRWSIYGQYELSYPLVFGHDTGIHRIVEWMAKRAIRRELGDAPLAERLTPRYRLGCKRILLSSEWYPALAQPHVQVETTGIERILPREVRLSDGRELELDALIYCTGFSVDRPLGSMVVTGRGGRDLATQWGPRPSAYLGITVSGFPNAFILLGPNTALGHNSVVLMIEAQVEYTLQAIQYLLERPELAWIDVDEAAQERFVSWVDERHSTQVWQSGCRSWYLDADGKNFTIWPGSTVSYIHRTRRFDPGPYRRQRWPEPGPARADPPEASSPSG